MISAFEKGKNEHAAWNLSIFLSVLGLVLSYIAFSPGLMTYDTFSAYNQTFTLEFTDWHHPFLSILMFFSRVTTGDTSLLLVFQLACIWFGIFLFSISIKKHIGNWSIFLILIAYFPFILNYAGFLGKTPLQTAMFLLVFGACYYYYSTDKRPPILTQIILFLALFLGTTIRTYSYVSAIPIIIFFIYVIIGKYNLRNNIFIYILSTLTIIILFFGVENFIIHKIIKVNKTYKIATLFEYDLAGIMTFSGSVYGERLLEPDFQDWEAIRSFYNKNEGNWKIIGIFGKNEKMEGRVYQNIFKQEDLDYLFKEWIDAIFDNPLSYITHRYQATLLALGIRTTHINIPNDSIFYHEINKYGLQKNQNIVFQIYKLYIAYFAQSTFFKPWFWFLINVMIFLYLILLLIRKKKSQRALPFIILNSSGTLFYVLYLFIGLSAMTRFVYWGMVSTILSLFGLVAISINSYFEKKAILPNAKKQP